MKGHVERTAAGRWKAWIDLPRGIDGKRRQRTKTCATRREVERWMAEQVAGEGADAGRQTVSQFLDRWMEHQAARLAHKTLATYRLLIDRHLVPGIGRIRLRDLNGQHIDELLGLKIREGLSAQSVRHVHACLRAALSQAMRWGLIDRNPAVLVQPPPAPRQRVRPLEPEEAARLLTELEGTQLRLPALLALATGMRRSEILGLRWENVDLDSDPPYLRVCEAMDPAPGARRRKTTKTRQEREVVIPQVVVEALHRQRQEQDARREHLGEYWEETGAVIDGLFGRHWVPDHFSQSWRRWIDARPHLRRITFHHLRHDAASLLLYMGVPIEVISKRLGHSTIKVTADLYSHLLRGRDAIAAEAAGDALRGRQVTPEVTER